MLLFLDTEYTGFAQAFPKLISIGIVAEDGRAEFYVELADTWTLEDCTAFVKREVLPLLDGPGIPRAEACAQLLTWLAHAPRSVQVACDSEADWLFLVDLLGTLWPANLANRYYDLRPLVDTTVYDQAVAAYYRTDAREHHALVDARAYRVGWLAWMDARKAKRKR
ncbi:3'-5' exoribonuclease [Burkholderia gladioli]|uniref:3'-5' exoribonuclease n=1 Tax=Burkholderia gladioli TaxID=28095 RepID=UPI00163F76C2|nr:3'-5' exoribonuclease [Burkholderia gladioli]